MPCLIVPLQPMFLTLSVPRGTGFIVVSCRNADTTGYRLLMFEGSKPISYGRKKTQPGLAGLVWLSVQRGIDCGLLSQVVTTYETLCDCL